MQSRPLLKADLPLQLVDAYHTMSWAGFDASPAFAYGDVRSWSLMTERAQRLGSEALTRTRDGALIAQEKEFIDKMAVCWRIVGYGMLYEPDVAKYSCSNPTQAEALTPYFKRLCRMYIAWFAMKGARFCRHLIDSGPVKLDRGKGAPYWSPRSDRAVAAAYARLAEEALDYNDLEHIVRSAGNAKLRFCQTSYVRVDRSRKPVPVYIPNNGRLEQQGEALRPKIRRIGAMPFAVNHIWAGVGNLLRTAMASIDDRNTGTIDPAMFAAASYKYTAAVDLSAYDTTVGIETLDALRTHLLAPILRYLAANDVLEVKWANLLTEADYAFQRYDVLVPPWSISESARLVEAAGQIRSGENLTSWKGTVINRCRIDQKIDAIGHRDTMHAAFNYGDDTVIMTDNAKMIDAWAAKPQWIGFNETVAPDASFLMRRLPYGYTYFGRMLGACINRESHQEPADAMEAAAAFATRAELLRDHPCGSDFLPTLAALSDKPEWSRAVAIAAGGASAVELTAMCAQRKLVMGGSATTDALAENLAALSRVPDARIAAEARAALARFSLQLHAHQRQVSWAELRSAARGMSLREAEREISRRSYTNRPK